MEGDQCPHCRATAITAASPPAGDGAIRQQAPPGSREPVDLPPLPTPDIRTGPPTAVGCVLVLLCVVVIFGLAIPVVRWRDPATGEPLPRMVAVVIPVLAGALCYGLGAGICKLLGVTLVKPPTPDSPPDVDAGRRPEK
jgi:hypothetical protein